MVDITNYHPPLYPLPSKGGVVRKKISPQGRGMIAKDLPKAKGRFNIFPCLWKKHTGRN
jgi:hypothetical protein